MPKYLPARTRSRFSAGWKKLAERDSKLLASLIVGDEAPRVLGAPQPVEIAAIKMRDKARRKLDKAEKMIAEKVDDIIRAARQLAMWQRRDRYYSRQVAKSDADLHAERERRLARKNERRSTTRRIRL